MAVDPDHRGDHHGGVRPPPSPVLLASSADLTSYLFCSCAVVSPFLIQNFPDTASFLTPEERAYCVARLAASSGEDTTGEKFSWQPIKDSLTDWKTYIGCVIYVGCDAPLYAFSLFTPSIIFVFKLFISPASVSAGRARCRQVLVLTSSLLLSNRNELGYSSIRANLISVPCYASACIVTVGLGFVSRPSSRSQASARGRHLATSPPRCRP